MKERKAKVTDLEKQNKDAVRNVEIAEENLKDAQKQMSQLQDEMKVVEKDAFKDFCASLKVKSIREYEEKITGGDNSFYDLKCELE